VAPSTDLVRAQIEYQTVLVQYERAKLDLVGKVCGVAIAALGLATAIVCAATAIIITLSN
jgi:hypothetical protein